MTNRERQILLEGRDGYNISGLLELNIFNLYAGVRNIIFDPVIFEQ